MLFERFETKGLSANSYIVGCKAMGEVAVVDPRRDTDLYERFAEREGVRISHVLETHIHADYASGARELADRTGAMMYGSAYDEGEQFEVSFPHEDLRDGDTIDLGAARLEALHTPGHTPEHLAFLVYDVNRSRTVPQLMLSGDFLFVGSVGRPDLLGDDETMELAGRMFDSVHLAAERLPDGLEIYPGHGAGSLCGAGMSGRALSTLGFEKIANPYFDAALSREAFIEKLVGSAPAFPPYYRRMKRVNSEGPALIGAVPGALPIPAREFRRLSDADHVVIDVRDQLSFGEGHVPGAFGIGAGPGIATWAPWIVPYDTPLLLVLPDDLSTPEATEAAHAAARHLIRVGLDDVRGYLDGGMDTWRSADFPTATLRQVSADELKAAIDSGDELQVLDVRSDAEWESGHIAGAEHIMAGYVADEAGRLPENGTMAIVCGSGYRSTAVASQLARNGRHNLANVTGGMTAWTGAGLPSTS